MSLILCNVLTHGGRHQQNTTDELEERVDVLEVTVLELGESLDTAEMSIDTLQIDVGVLNTNLEGTSFGLDIIHMIICQT